jgi:hypothetical protein
MKRRKWTWTGHTLGKEAVAIQKTAEDVAKNNRR